MHRRSFSIILLLALSLAGAATPTLASAQDRFPGIQVNSSTLQVNSATPTTFGDVDVEFAYSCNPNTLVSISAGLLQRSSNARANGDSPDVPCTAESQKITVRAHTTTGYFTHGPAIAHGYLFSSPCIGDCTLQSVFKNVSL
ncbi:hypothetical protein [Actinoplanes siamensis]|uniref:Neocarzinostatin family protein n=1 Tax=Actinoplanes siamensis TaxID=1223317 RepID=A0A919KBN2_9ACTN|nr:hypothetical protein [Actinoplanes siamensis]GIF02463.1 hypothetical protein Asi03nite_00010 [Actinoplanes siamensis]